MYLYKANRQIFITTTEPDRIKTLEFTHYYGKHKRRNNAVLQSDVVQTKIKKYQFRADIELINDIENFKKEMNQDTSKVITDILNDFFLTKNLREQKLDVEYFIKFANKKHTVSPLERGTKGVCT